MMGVIHENQYRGGGNKYRRPHYEQRMDRFQMMMKFKEMMDDMQYDNSFMDQDMMPYSMMKSKYNDKWGMDNKMDMGKFEKMFDMVKQMKHQSYKMDEMRDSSPIAAFRSAMNFDNNNHKSMDFNKMANFFKNFRSKRAADTDALALNDRLKEKIQHVFEEQQSKIGNMTCVLREMNCLNAENEIDVRAMKRMLSNTVCPAFGSRTGTKRSLTPATRLPPTFQKSLTSKKSLLENLEPSTWDVSRAS